MDPDTKVLRGKLLKMAGTLNRKQKVCLWAGAAVIAGMVVYPPWVARLVDEGGVHSRTRSGYAWLWAPPKLPWEPYGARFTLELTPSLPRLSVQCGVAAIITFSLMVAFKNNQKRKVRVPIVVIDSLVVVVGLSFFIDMPPPMWHRGLAMALPFVVPLIILVLFELKR
ncbi:MAG TPA: hypothetical protein VMX13_04415 [Sedimentisphaerales bacterium]|nr:hypothetical protein [Sedimentisphaerales bacterium]